MDCVMKPFSKSFFLLVLVTTFWGCPMAQPGNTTTANPTEPSPGPTSPSTPNASGMTNETGGRAVENEAPDSTASQPVAMPSGVFSSGTTPECGVVVHLTARPLCFYADSSKQVEFSGKVFLECDEGVTGKIDSPAIRIINKQAEFLELPLLGDDHSFKTRAKAHQSPLSLDSCFINRDPVFSFLEPGLLDMMACEGEACTSKCDETFDRIEIEEIDPRPVPVFSMPGETLSFRTANLLPPCGTAPEIKTVPGADPIINVR